MGKTGKSLVYRIHCTPEYGSSIYRVGQKTGPVWAL